MKVIDLLNRIANCEETPVKIKFKGKEYEWSQEFYDYRCLDQNHKYLVEDLETEDLNRTCEEIPIIEDKKIEPLKLNNSDVWTGKTNEDLIVDKINEIIDKLNKEE